LGKKVITLAKRRRYRLRNPPFAADGKLRDISLGISLGEGYTGCSKGYPYIGVTMCDKKAVEMVAKAWGTKVEIRKRKKPSCRPTIDNPEGHMYETRARAGRADAVMEGYEPEIIGTELYQKWTRTLRRCKPRRKAKTR